jgi:hypothetical protein
MKKYRKAAALTAMAGLVIYLVGGFGVPAASSEARNAFGFNSTNIAGFPTGEVTLTGGGAYVPGTSSVHALRMMVLAPPFRNKSFEAVVIYNDALRRRPGP